MDYVRAGRSGGVTNVIVRDTETGRIDQSTTPDGAAVETGANWAPRDSGDPLTVRPEPQASPRQDRALEGAGIRPDVGGPGVDRADLDRVDAARADRADAGRVDAGRVDAARADRADAARADRVDADRVDTARTDRVDADRVDTARADKPRLPRRKPREEHQEETEKRRLPLMSPKRVRFETVEEVEVDLETGDTTRTRSATGPRKPSRWWSTVKRPTRTNTIPGALQTCSLTRRVTPTSPKRPSTRGRGQDVCPSPLSSSRAISSGNWSKRWLRGERRRLHRRRAWQGPARRPGWRKSLPGPRPQHGRAPRAPGHDSPGADQTQEFRPR